MKKKNVLIGLILIGLLISLVSFVNIFSFPYYDDVALPTAEPAGNKTIQSQKHPSLSNVALLVPTFPGGFDELNRTLIRSLQFFWPLDELNLTIILDDDVPNHAQQEATLRSMMAPKVRVQIHYNPLTHIQHPRRGWIIQQWIMFWADNFTDAPYIGLLDDDTLVSRHVTPYDLFDEQGRPRAIVKYFSGIRKDWSWVTDFFKSSHAAYKYTQKSYVYGMSYFPVLLKREHFAEIRQVILDLNPTYHTFDDFFREFVQTNFPFGQFQIMLDHLWRTRREDYSWHFEAFHVGGPFFPHGLPHSDTVYPYIQPGTPAENGVTEQMLRPFPRAMMHASYTAQHHDTKDRDVLMQRVMRRGYCLSLPIQQQQHSATSNTSILSQDDAARQCQDDGLFQPDRWTDISQENLWEFEAFPYGIQWPKYNYEGCLQAHQDRLLRNRVRKDGWDSEELARLFPG